MVRRKLSLQHRPEVPSPRSLDKTRHDALRCNLEKTAEQERANGCKKETEELVLGSLHSNVFGHFFSFSLHGQLYSSVLSLQ